MSLVDVGLLGLMFEFVVRPKEKEKRGKKQKRERSCV
jgi:hypothetical protein